MLELRRAAMAALYACCPACSASKTLSLLAFFAEHCGATRLREGSGCAQALLTTISPTSACGLQVPAAHVTRLDIIPDIDAGAVNITVLGSKEAEGAATQVTVLDREGHKVYFQPHVSCQLFRLFLCCSVKAQTPDKGKARQCCRQINSLQL